MTTDLCVDVRRRRDGETMCQRLAIDGAYLCQGHRRELERLIAEMPARHGDLDRPTGAGGPPVRGGGEHGITVDEAAADLRRQIQHDLVFWCVYVADERGIGRPRRDDPLSLAAWLTRHVDWLVARREAAEELLPVLRELTGRALGIIDLRARRIELGERCLTHEGGERCTGTVTLVIRGDDWLARCGECGHDQEATQYLRIAQRGTWITAEDVIRLAELFGVAANVDLIYQWKRRKHITGMVGPAENLYDLGSVQRYLVRRTAERERMSA